MWGDPIECNGVRPDWLRDDEYVTLFWRDENIWSGLNNGYWTVEKFDAQDWSGVSRFTLPADHPAYVALAKGFTPWLGGENAPDDWDGGAVLIRNGSADFTDPASWTHPWRGDGPMEPYDVIGYRKRDTTAHNARVEREGESTLYGVFVECMTQAEAVERLMDIPTLQELGIIRDETDAERFTRETGHEVTEAVEAALAWRAGK